MTERTPPAELTGGAAAVEQALRRPRLRGTFHLAAALLAPLGLLLLVAVADSPRGYVGGSIFAVSLMLMYSASASYHLAPWPPKIQPFARRLDHSMIFVLIGGTYTPFCLVIVDNAWGIVMLSVVWSLAGAGVLMRVFWLGAPRWLIVATYMAVGWTALAFLPLAITYLEPAALAVLAFGGALYTVGAVVYGLKRPDPFPAVFGYHEIFHLFVVAGTLAHFGLIAAHVLPS
jgi:hemolysin III